MKIGNLEVYGIIYRIQNLVNGKVYIGQTTRAKGFNGRYPCKGRDIERVYNYHKKIRDKGYKVNYNLHLLNSLEKYGLDNFRVDNMIDIAFSKNELNIKEACWINIYNSTDGDYGYNNKEGGSNGKLKEDILKQMSINNLGFDIEEYKNEIIDKYNNGLSYKEIAESLPYSITPETISKYIRRWMSKIRSLSESKLGFNINCYKEEIINQYLHCKKLGEVASKYNVDKDVIKRILKENNILIFKSSEARTGININKLKELIIKDYVINNMNLNEISLKYNLSEETISRKLKEWNIRVKSCSEVRLGFNIKDYKDDIIFNYTKLNMNIKEIAKQYGDINEGVIRKILKDNDIKIRNNSETSLGFDIEQLKEEIIDMYINKKYSPLEIRKFYNNKICVTTIKNWLRKWGVKMRTLSESKKGHNKGENHHSSISIILFDSHTNNKIKFESMTQCGEWLTEQGLCKNSKSGRDIINRSIKNNKPYKNRYKFIKEKN